MFHIQKQLLQNYEDYKKQLQIIIKKDKLLIYYHKEKIKDLLQNEILAQTKFPES